MIIKINNTQFAVGATWSTLLDHSDIEKQIKSVNKRYYSVFESEYVNYFATHTFSKMSGKIYSLASFTGELINNKDFVLAIESGENVYFVGFRDGVLDIKTDKFKKSSEAQKLINQYAHSHNIKDLYYVGSLKIIDSLFIENKHQLQPSDFRNLSKKHLVIDLNKKSSNIKNFVVILICISVLGTIAYFASKDLFKEIPIVNEVADKGPTDEEIKAFKKAHIKNKLNTLYQSAVPVEYLQNCINNKSLLFENKSFWSLNSFDCSPSKSKHTYIREPFGLNPSNFTQAVNELAPNASVSFTEKFPVNARVSINTSYTPRTFIPEDVNQISELSNKYLFDLLTRFSDIGTVTGYKLPQKITVPSLKLRDTHVQFKTDELYSIGTFKFKHDNFNNILITISQMDSDYVFINHLNHKGGQYEIDFNYLTR